MTSKIMPPLKITYKTQYLNKISGFWEDLATHPGNFYDDACKFFYNQYKLDNSRQYRLIQIKEELIDSLYPPGS